MATRWNQSDSGQFADPSGGRKDKMPGSRHCGTLPPEVHYQVSKKIAQLTKVIFTLNARLDEQESMMEALKDAYEERLQQLLSDTKQRIAQYKAKANTTTDLQHKITELESTITLERAAKEELVQALKMMREKRLHEQCCKSCGSNLTNGLYTKSISKEFESSSVSSKTTLRNKEEEMEIIERILRKKSSVGKSDTQSKTNTKVKQMVDIPEKDGSRDTPNQRNSSSPPETPAQENGKIGESRFEPKCGADAKIVNENNDSDSARKEREFLNKISENQKEMQSMQNQIKNLTRSLTSTESDLRKLQVKANTAKNGISTQTEWPTTESESQTQPEESPDLTNKAKKVEAELKNTLDELQSISAALNETKTQIQNTHVELRRFSADGPREMPQFLSAAHSSTVADESSANERTKFELKDKVSELLEQVTILMTNGGGNMSDAEKENAELRKRLTEKEEACRKQLAAKDNQIAATLKEKEGEIKRVEAELTRQHNLSIEVALINHRRELENVIRVRDDKWASQKDAIQREHDAQLSKVQEDVNEMSRRLQSQTEIQTAELARLNHDLNETLNVLRQKEEDALLRETKWRKDAQESKENFQEQLRQAQKQSDQFLKQLDQKRDEVLQVRREATQQIRNLENYWVEKVNQELNRLKRAFNEEKKKMLEHFNKSQRLLRDKILVLQSRNPNAEEANNLDKDDDEDEFVNPPSPITRKDVHRIRRDSVVSQIEFPTHENDLIDFTEAMEKQDERICASQPNVAQLPPQPRITNKKGKGSGEHRFIKRAESVFLPKLQFLSFWKSASSLDKAECQRHRDTCSSSPSFPKDVTPAEQPSTCHPQMTPELDPRKKQKMSPTFFKNRSGSEGFEGFSFQESRSSSCFNLSCKVGNPLFGSEGFSLLNKSKRNSVGSNNYLGVVPEAHLDDVEECTKEDEGTNKKESKEPLLESEL